MERDREDFEKERVNTSRDNDDIAGGELGREERGGIHVLR